MKNKIEEIIATRNPRRFKFLSDKIYLSIKFKYIFGRKIDWNNPKTFNVLEDCLNQITASCVGLGVSGRLKLNLNETVWELKL